MRIHRAPLTFHLFFRMENSLRSLQPKKPPHRLLTPKKSFLTWWKQASMKREWPLKGNYLAFLMVILSRVEKQARLSMLKKKLADSEYISQQRKERFSQVCNQAILLNEFRMRTINVLKLRTLRRKEAKYTLLITPSRIQGTHSSNQ